MRPSRPPGSGSTTSTPTRVVGTLSGGQRTRLALATIMTTRPTCLLLDEPTNHLDDDAIEVLTGFLRDLPGVVLLASHDRVLLDDVCTDLVDLDAGELGTDGSGGRRFGGGWSAYEAARADARRRWEETYAVQQEELSRLRAATRIGTGAIAHDRGPTDGDKYIYSFKGGRVDQTLARRKKDAQRRLEVAEREQVRKPPAPLRFRGDLTTAASGRLVQARDVEVAGRMRVARLDLAAGEHLLLTGPNGSGKSTLLGVLSGRLAATGGSVDVSARTVRELTQDPQPSDPARSALATYDAAVRDLADPPRLRELGLLHPRDHRTPVGSLSVGQRRRLSSRSRSPPHPTCCCSTSRPTTSRSPSPASSRRRSARPPAGSCWPPTTGGCDAAGRGRSWPSSRGDSAVDTMPSGGAAAGRVGVGSNIL